MKTISYYQCEFCKTEFKNDSNGAELCEATHLDFDDIKYEDSTHTKLSLTFGFPAELYFSSTHRGAVAKYILKEENSMETPDNVFTGEHIEPPSGTVEISGFDRGEV
jgi:hypothetical protein